MGPIFWVLNRSQKWNFAKKIGSFDSLSKTAYMTQFSWILNNSKLSGPFLGSRGRKRGQKWNFDRKVGSLDSWSKTAYMTLFSWDLNDFKLSGPFLASIGRKRGQKWNFANKLYIVCSLDPNEHPDQISNFFFVRCARKRFHNVWTNVVFQFSNFKTRIFAFFQFFPKQNGPANFTSLSFPISPKCPIHFCNPRPKNRAKVWWVLKKQQMPNNMAQIFPFTYQ